MDGPLTELLSPLAHRIINAAEYDRLVVEGGTPAKARELLADVSPDELLAVPVKSIGHAYSMLCGLWLWHDALHECHEIAQAEVDSLHRTALNLHRKRSKPSQNTGSVQSVEIDKDSFSREIATAMTSLNFWHAIMHRREGDFSNAKYWYRRCDTHHVNKLMGAIASSLAGDLAGDPAVAHAIHDGWNPIGFVDLVQAVQHKPSDPRHELAVRLQRAEWEGLFNYCVRAAVDGDKDNLDEWDNRVIHPAGG